MDETILHGPGTLTFLRLAHEFTVLVDRMHQTPESDLIHRQAIRAAVLRDQLAAAFDNAIVAWETGAEPNPPEKEGVLAAMRLATKQLRELGETTHDG